MNAHSTIEGRAGNRLAAVAIVLLSMIPAFWLYIETMTPPSEARDLLIHVVFFPLVYPVVPVFLDGAFGQGAAAYAVYPAIAIALVLLAGTRNPLRLAAIALATAFLLPWAGEIGTIMGYEGHNALSAALGSPILASLWMVAMPLAFTATAIFADARIGGPLALVAGLLVAGAVLVGHGLDLAVGGWIALAAGLASIALGGRSLYGGRVGGLRSR
ncbi:MAG: hypothetical protein RLO50_07325 [Azospirillaceae bacterium]